MKVQNIIPILLLLVLTINMNGQEVERSTVSSNGSSVATGALQLDYTFGGMVVKTSPVTASFQVSAGYHQTGTHVSVNVIDPDGKMDASIFSNPVYDVLFLDINIDKKVNYIIVDELGRTILKGEANPGQTRINIKEIAQAQYFLTLTASDASERLTIPFLKL